MLDRVADMAAHEAEEAPALDVAGATAGAQYLPPIPFGAALVLAFLAREPLDPLRAVAAEDEREPSPGVQHVGGKVAGQHRQEERPGEQRESR